MKIHVLFASVFPLLLVMATPLFADTHYVCTNSPGSTNPYTNWLTAATNIQHAVDAASDGDIVLVSNGIYKLSSQISISKGILVQSAGGTNETVVHGNDSVRCFYLSHSNAVLDSLTITKGRAGIGGGVYCNMGGLVQNCKILNNRVLNNWPYTWGGGVYCHFGGIVRNCLIAGNSAGTGSGGENGGGVACLRDGLVQGCLIVNNTAGWWGGGVFSDSSTFENCTIMGNTANRGGGAAWTWASNIVVNSIIVSNIPANYHNEGGVTYAYCCTTPLVPGENNITNDPQVVSVPMGDYRLNSNSPCIDAGINVLVPWALDYDGYPRIVSGTIDIGAHEFIYSVDDYDGDGLSNAVEETVWFTDPTLSDTDGDSQSDPEEVFITGTDATNPASYFHIQIETGSADGLVTWSNIIDRTYYVWTRGSLATGDWTTVAAYTNRPAGTTTHTNMLSAPKQFFRVSVVNTSM